MHTSMNKKQEGLYTVMMLPKIKYRVRNGYITPYVEIRVPKEALKKIVVGPTNNKMLTVQSIYHFLQINGYDINKIDVVSSKIPYRG